MPAKFDPVEVRSLVEFQLQHGFGRFDPESGPVAARHLNASIRMNSLIKAFFVGLSDRVKPTLEAIADWIESQPLPDRRLVSQAYDWQSGWSSHLIWWQTLGLCKWLARSETAEKEFAKALDAEWNSWMEASPAQVAEGQWDRERELGENLALALAGNRPGFGLKLYEAANPQEPMDHELPVLQFGLWACRHLAAGGKRDAEFVARGAEMLRDSLLPNFFHSADRRQPALWLKAIYWDSGMVRTPEQAFSRAYDSMPGVERPDFVVG